MANSQDELEALGAQLGALTTRIYRLEQKAGIEPAAAPPAPLEKPAVSAPPPKPAAAAGAPPSLRAPLPGFPSASPTVSTQPASSGDLEGKIGKVWLNRIGIVAMLFGVTYFLKHAFDNDWIGPKGRVAIGLIAGIAIVIWSEVFRRKNYKAFSY